MKSIFEEMGGTYRQEGDYLVLNIKLPEQEEYQLGKYGRMRRNFLKDHHPTRYSDLIVEGQLWNHLAEIDKLCNARMEVMIALKAADQMEQVRRMNRIHNRAEEIVLYELVYEV